MPQSIYELLFPIVLESGSNSVCIKKGSVRSIDTKSSVGVIGLSIFVSLPRQAVRDGVFILLQVAAKCGIRFVWLTP